ncbi:hypothetical protein WA538_003227, partial [Blastocystis sp. DL]
MFSGLFGPKDKRTPEEKYADMKKDIRANVREIDRQIRKLERELKKSEDDIKRSAKNGSSLAVLKAKCKSRVMLQNAINRLQGVRTNVESLLTNVILQKAQILQMEAMKKGSISMKLINDGMDADGMRQVVADFQKEMMKNEINTGMIDDAFTEPDSGEVDAEVDKALFEVAGVKMSDLVAAGTGGVKIGDQQQQQQQVRSAGLPDIPMN